MSRLSKRKWYERVNASWPQGQLPPLTAAEAITAAKRLYRFVKREPWRGPVRVTSGNRGSGFGWEPHPQKPGYSRRVLVVNPEQTWRAFVHYLSHDFHRGAHGREHAIVERRMIKEVVRRGWLEGKLKRPEKPKVKVDLPALRYKRVLAHIARWEKIEKKARTRLRTLRAQKRGYERRRPDLAAAS